MKNYPIIINDLGKRRGEEQVISFLTLSVRKGRRGAMGLLWCVWEWSSLNIGVRAGFNTGAV